MADQPPVLNYRNDDPVLPEPARVAMARFRQGPLSLARYWMWYYGGPWYLAGAAAAGVGVAGLLTWACGVAGGPWCAYVGGTVTFVVVQLRPRRRDW